MRSDNKSTDTSGTSQYFPYIAAKGKALLHPIRKTCNQISMTMNISLVKTYHSYHQISYFLNWLLCWIAKDTCSTNTVLHYGPGM